MEWGAEILYILPLLLFFSALSVLLSFWSSMVLRTTSVNKVFLVLNCIVYSSVISIVSYSIYASRHDLFMKTCLFGIGICDSLAAAGCAYYGIRVALHLSAESPLFETRQLLIRRVFWVCVVCTSVFLFRGISTLLLVVNGYLGLPWNPSLWHAINFAVLEWTPSLLLIVILRTSLTCSRRSKASYPPILAYANDDDMYPIVAA